MLSAFKEFLRRHLPTDLFRLASYSWWMAYSCLPRIVSAAVIRRRSIIHIFPPDETNQLLSTLRDVNVAAPTEMCRVMTWYGSDKGRLWHNYTTIYSRLFSSLRSKPVRILEVGLGTNNPNIAYGMGIHGRPGASLRGWRELFPHALVYGADIDRDVLFVEDRIKTFFCDQLDANSIRQMWADPHFQKGLDIIIDDGLHTYEGNVNFLENSLEHVVPGGYFVVEDIHHGLIERWSAELESVYSVRFSNFEFAFLQLPNPSNAYDNNLLIARRIR